jgi:predicted MFS family arabinose efflux permease
VLGGLIVTDWNWRGIFLVNIPIGIFALAVTIWRVEEFRAPAFTRPDWIGFGLLTTGLVGLIYGLIRASETSWTDTWVLSCLAAGLVLLAAFVLAETRVANPMFDVRLFRVPTFAGGSISAFAMNGSLYAMMLYLVIYLQDILGFSALDAGLRVSVITLATLVTATAAGRLSEHMPVRWLIGPGLLLVGTGLIVMAGLTGTSSWTHLIPGFIISGLGCGLVNPPLASTAIGVVPPNQAGMASGANSTFRQIGIATGIAALGSIFVSQMQSHLASALPRSLAGSAGPIAAAVRQGSVGRALASVPAADRGATALALRSSFASGLNELLYITAALALVGGVSALLLIRSKDFVKRESAAPSPAGAPDSAAPASART